MKRVLTISMAAVSMLLTSSEAATNLVSNTAIVTNRVQGIVTYTMSNGVARVQDPSGKLIGTAEERALKVAAEGQVDIASAAADAAGTAMEEWREFSATTDVKVVYIDAGFTQDLPALAPNLCGWVAGSFYDREKGEDHYYVWFNREIDYPPSMCARIVSESGTNWLDGAWKDWAVTNWIDTATGREWTRPYSAEVEYINSNGTNYFDTGILPFDGVVLEWGFKHTGDIVIYHQAGFGVNGLDHSQSSLRIIYGSYAYYNIIAPSVSCYFSYGANQKHDVVLSSTKMIFDGKEYSIRKGSVIPQSTIRGGNITSSLNNSNLYYSRIIDGRTQGSEYELFDAIPVLDLSGRPAMYDRVSGQLFYNQGTGEFAYGPVTAAPVPCRELVVPRRNANCVLKTGTVITLGGRDGFDADIHKVNIEVSGTPTATTSAQLPLFYAVTRSGTNTVTRAYTNGFVNVENGFIKEPGNE